MNNSELAAARRRNTIAELVESMRAAQRNDRLKRIAPCVMVRTAPQIGVWKGGCK